MVNVYGKRGMKKVKCFKKSKNQLWFTANKAEGRKAMHKSEAR